MRREGNNPLTEFTVSSVLCACASKCDVLTSKQLHCFSIKNSMDENVFVGTALLDVYSKSGFVHDIKDKVHTFMAGERKHPRIMEILLELDRLMEETKKRGVYKPDAGYELHDVEQGKKLELLKHHSEKLAVCFGLMSLPEGIPIRIMKNLRICGDCHSFMKSVSSVESREIIVRDTNRFHHFWNGHCSCNDFW
ncbi:unnamed protein product [Linum tenue]|uniref:DYW domain-containing protein n=1 Tax=Linum tenue TaxID=586396 RepID=A0AAV0MVI1_9ROSI|nr:unnamed protein product [Linum tenue]